MTGAKRECPVESTAISTMGIRGGFSPCTGSPFARLSRGTRARRCASRARSQVTKFAAIYPRDEYPRDLRPFSPMPRGSHCPLLPSSSSILPLRRRFPGCFVNGSATEFLTTRNSPRLSLAGFEEFDNARSNAELCGIFWPPRPRGNILIRQFAISRNTIPDMISRALSQDCRIEDNYTMHMPYKCNLYARCRYEVARNSRDDTKSCFLPSSFSLARYKSHLTRSPVVIYGATVVACVVPESIIIGF